jgi:C1A family cysteine protease
MQKHRPEIHRLITAGLGLLLILILAQPTVDRVQAGPETIVKAPNPTKVIQQPISANAAHRKISEKSGVTQSQTGHGTVPAGQIQTVPKNEASGEMAPNIDNSAEKPMRQQGVSRIRFERTESTLDASGVVELGSGTLNVQIPDLDNYWISMWTTETLPTGAEVTDLQYRVRIDDINSSTGEDGTFYCGDYEIYLSSEAHGAPNKYLLVYNNLGDRTDNGYDDDADDDSDIYLNMRSTSAFNGEDPAQRFCMWIEDTQSGDYGLVNYVEFDIYWEAPLPDLVATYSEVSAETVREGESIWIRNRLKNAGDGDAGESFAKVFLSPGDDWDQSDDIEITPKKKVRALASGEEVELQWDFTFPDMSTGSASYDVWVMIEVDCNNEVEESNESNYYKRTGALKVWPGQTDPDIEVTPLELVINQPTASVPPPETGSSSAHALGLVIPEEVKVYWTTHQPDLKYETEAFAASIDWSNNDSPVKNQGNCGSCWAFSAIGLIENLCEENDLSEQALVSCIPDNDCGGGWHGYALEYINIEGTPDEACFPYEASNGNCSDKCSDPAVLAKIQTYDKYGRWGEPTSQTVNDLKALLQTGPALVTLDVPDDGTFDNYNGGIYNYSGGQIPAGRGHSVLAVGYDDAQQYFKVKNSWGSNWGESGYFRISFNDVTDDVNFGGYACTGEGITIERTNNDKFTISNAGGGNLAVSAISSNKSWLSFDPTVPPTLTLTAGASRAIQCNVNWAAVTLQSDVAQVTIQSNDPDENPVTVTVRVNKNTNPVPVLVVEPASLAFSANFGQNPANQTLSIRNGGTGNMSWSVSDNQTWLTVTPTSGSTTTEADPVTVQVNSAALNAGTYSATITVTAAGAQGSPKNIPVSLTIQSQPTTCVPPFLQAVDVTGMAGSQITLDVNLEKNPTAIDAFGFKLSFCTQKLTLVSVEKGTLINNFSFFQANQESPGVIRIGGFHTAAVPAQSSGNFIKIKFQVQACQVGETCNLTVHDLVDDLAGLNACNGIFTCGVNCDLGDVNRDGSITAGDALCAFQIYMNGGTPSADCANECAVIAADANCDGAVTSGDALVIFMAYMQGLRPPLQCPTGIAKSAAQPDIQLQIHPVLAESGTDISVPVYLQSNQKVQSFSFDLGFPADLLRFVGVTPGNLTRDWLALDGKENLDGVITLGGYHSAPMAAPQRDVLLYVQFKLKQDTGAADLWIFNPADDLAPAQIENAALPLSASVIEALMTSEIPVTYSLEQNFPNPFNLETEIAYQIPEEGRVDLFIYNSLGQKIRVLVQQNQPAGKYRVHWNGLNTQGLEVPSGIYFYQMITNEFKAVKKLLLIK